MQRSASILAALLLLTTILGAQKPEEQSKDGNARLTLQVLDQTNKQAVADAHVIVRFAEQRILRRDKRVAWEAKTNRKGIVVLSDIPRGSVKVQVIAKGFQTYGDQHELDKPEEELTILLQPPKGQVSAY